MLQSPEDREFVLLRLRSIVTTLVASASVELFHPFVEEQLWIRGQADLVAEDLFPMWNARDEIGGVGGLVGFDKLQEADPVVQLFLRSAGG